MARALINAPAKAKKGEIIEIKTLIQHPMDSGYRVGLNGALIPRDIINAFTCSWNGEEIFSADLSTAMATNPFITFWTRATESGAIVFKWTGDNKFSAEETVQITVE